MSSVQPISFTTSYPSLLFSSIHSGWEHCSPPSDGVTEDTKSPRHDHIYAPQPQRLSSLLQNASTKNFSPSSAAFRAKRLSSPQSDASCNSHSSTPSLAESVSTSSSLSRNHPTLSQRASSTTTTTTRSGRVRVPLPFSQDLVEQRVAFSSRHGAGGGVSLADWARLAEKRRTHLALGDAHVRIDELVADDGARILFQSHWPGYASRTRFLELPRHASELERGFTKADLLDMVCGELLQWVLTLTNDRHIVCCEPGWAVGLDQITFRHVFVVGVVRTRGYVSKWVPVLEVDRSAFAA